MSPARLRLEATVLLVLGTADWIARCERLAGDRALVVGRGPEQATLMVVAWQPRAVVLLKDTLAGIDPSFDEALGRLKAKLVRVPAESISDAELDELISWGIGISGTRRKG